MSVQDEIIDEFIDKLKQDKNFTEQIVSDLKELLTSEVGLSKEKLSQIIDRGFEN